MYKFRILHPSTLTRLRLQPMMHGLVGILFLFNAIGVYQGAQPNYLMAAFFILLGLGSILLPFVLRRFRKFGQVNSMVRVVQAFTCFTGSLYFLSHGKPDIAGLLLLVGIGIAYVGYTEYKILQPAFARLDTMGVTLPATFSEKNFSWTVLQNAVLRNDLFTLDFKNNKILQVEVLDDLTTSEQESINTFCQSRL
ncbi:hypothetical protein GA0116948_10495 [Chitinophaga costaii]|uniref:Uncharacterized protein n=1 Tax=Chitinophaga costaii TaxID=1335309 RepID=A0A1C4CF84_9BACT|nr:hypothetical protein [Chitinophaga costaii]SCC17668.1 hypothetical protein GA0116948_10495 [Chitinophaga costaii]